MINDASDEYGLKVDTKGGERGGGGGGGGGGQKKREVSSERRRWRPPKPRSSPPSPIGISRSLSSSLSLFLFTCGQMVLFTSHVVSNCFYYKLQMCVCVCVYYVLCFLSMTPYLDSTIVRLNKDAYKQDFFSENLRDVRGKCTTHELSTILFAWFFFSFT